MADEKAKRQKCGELSGKLNVKGEPCGAYARKGKTTCIGHADKAEQAEAGFGGAENGAKGGEARRVPKLTEILRQRVEERADEIIDKLFAGLGAQRALVVGTGPQARVEIVNDPDQVLKTIKEIYDRFEGRPRQVAEITGADGGPIEHAPVGIPTEEEFQAGVAAVLAGAGANGASGG